MDEMKFLDSSLKCMDHLLVCQFSSSVIFQRQINQWKNSNKNDKVKKEIKHDTLTLNFLTKMF
jgi:hypothetical protein